MPAALGFNDHTVIDGAVHVALPSGHVAIVDTADLSLVSRYRWMAAPLQWHTYVMANVYRGRRRTKLYLHRLLTDAPIGMVVDHINRNGLDNRRANLRLCTQTMNNGNRKPPEGQNSQYKGVLWEPRHQRWVARIQADGAPTYLGEYRDEREAALAYDRAAERVFGEFAYLNFPAA